MTHAGSLLWLLFFSSSCSVISLTAQTQFIPLGYLDGNGPTSEANAVTPDGSKVVGYSTTSLTENLACWWTTNGIAVVPGVQNWLANAAYGISADGNVIVGDRSFGGTEEAWYWTPANQTQLVPFAQAPRAATARGLSRGGQVIVGTETYVDFSGAKTYAAFRWDRSQPTATLLQPYPGSTFPSTGAFAVSDDGRRVVGAVQTSLTTQAAARWDDGGAPVLFSKLGDTIVAVTAQALVPDGSIVVGSGVNSVTGKGVAFRWSAASGVLALPNPTTGRYAIDGATALDISSDGRVIVGYGQNVAGDDEAIFWVDGQAYRVSDVAVAAGVLPPSWEPFRAHATDYFGNTICGYGRATSGKLEAYVLVLDATPAAPPVVAPALRTSFNAGNRTLSIRYATVPGLRYRVHGGSSLQSLTPVGNWNNGTGAEQEFVATAIVTGDAASYFLRVEVAAN